MSTDVQDPEWIAFCDKLGRALQADNDRMDAERVSETAPAVDTDPNMAAADDTTAFFNFFDNFDNKSAPDNVSAPENDSAPMRTLGEDTSFFQQEWDRILFGRDSEDVSCPDPIVSSSATTTNTTAPQVDASTTSIPSINITSPTPFIKPTVIDRPTPGLLAPPAAANGKSRKRKATEEAETGHFTLRPVMGESL
ncbi:MAG: hypothetical protein Q9222_002409, partial [Ikaeria aurantiellina]